MRAVEKRQSNEYTRRCTVKCCMVIASHYMVFPKGQYSATMVRKPVCGSHAKAYAVKHGIDMKEPCTAPEVTVSDTMGGGGEV